MLDKGLCFRWRDKVNQAPPPTGIKNRVRNAVRVGQSKERGKKGTGTEEGGGGERVCGW